VTTISPAHKYFSAGLAGAVENMTTSPGAVRAVTEDCLVLIRAREPALRSMVHVDEQGALAQADKLDTLLAEGSEPLPLHGIPVVIKEIYSIDGMPDSSGSKLPTPELFEPEGKVMHDLRSAGCVILGKSFSVEFAFGQFNLDRTMPVNPCARQGDTPEDRATGGSSSGSAAAQAAGYCGFAMGTDTGGSVRLPAALCGVVGFKPSEGSLDTGGIFTLSAQLDTPGFFCNSVTDAALIFDSLGGKADVFSAEVDEFCIGIPSGDLVNRVDSEVAAAWSGTLQQLESTGVSFIEIDMPSLETAGQYFAKSLPVELLNYLGREYVIENQSLLDQVTHARLQPFLDGPPVVFQPNDFGEIRQEALSCLAAAGVDCWMIPTVPCVAPLLSELENLEAVADWQGYVSRNTRYTSLLGHAAISLPLPDDLAGLMPVAVQISAPAGRDQALLQAATRIESLLDC